MPLAVTHVLLTIIVIDIFRDYIIKKKKLIPLKYIFIGGVAGILPDIDIAVFWLLSFFKPAIEWFHGTFTHIFLIPLVILVASLIAYKYNKKVGISPFWPFFNTAFKGLSTFFDIPAFEMGLDAFILLGWLWHEEKKHKISDFI